MEKYSKYKDSGVKWIGDIPAHWEVRLLSQMATLHYLSNKDVHHQNLLSLSYGRIINKDINGVSGLLPASYDTYQIIENGNIVLRLTDLQNDQKSLRVGLCTQEGIITSAYLALQPRVTVLPAFLYLLLHTADIMKVFYSMGNGLRQNLNWGELRKLSCVLPPLAEQRAIVSYLDGKVGQIDTYIAKQTQQIELLKELKQAVIANAVTKGISNDNNYHTKLKQSGVSWIGEIPEHWEVKRAKNMFIRMAREVRDEDAVITCFRDGQVTLRKNRRVDGFTESLKEIGYQGIRKGDLVIHQMDAFAGSIGVSDSDGKGTPVYICLQPKGDCSNNYYMYLLREMARTGFIKSLYRGIRERSSDFRYETFAKLFLPIPPLPEQRAIVSYIEAQTANIDKLINAYQQQVERIKELKQRLISDAVTGKINVTGKQTQTN
jgi:putative type I site-specific restriction-modification system, S subunit